MQKMYKTLKLSINCFKAKIAAFTVVVGKYTLKNILIFCYMYCFETTPQDKSLNIFLICFNHNINKFSFTLIK